MAVNDSTLRSHNFKDLTGQRFGRLVAISFACRNRNGRAAWNCLCDCGSECVVAGTSLTRRQPTRSCGCLQREETGARFRTHGLKNTAEHNVWSLMIRRCYNENRPDYGLYGGRGVTVCERWRTSFQAFYDDMGPRPSNRHSIDRIDNDGNYEPCNCRWATQCEQARNKRSNRLITFNGRTLCLAEWAEEYGMRQRTLWYRLNRGWSVERALTEPVRER